MIEELTNLSCVLIMVYISVLYDKFPTAARDCWCLSVGNPRKHYVLTMVDMFNPSGKLNQYLVMGSLILGDIAFSKE